MKKSALTMQLLCSALARPFFLFIIIILTKKVHIFYTNEKRAEKRVQKENTELRYYTNHVGELVQTQSEAVVAVVVLLDARRALRPDLAACDLLVGVRVELAVRRLPRAPLVVQRTSACRGEEKQENRDPARHQPSSGKR